MAKPRPITSQNIQMRCVSTKAVMPMAMLHMKISPVKPSRQFGFCAAGGDARAKRGPEARDGVEVAAVALALCGEEAGFFAEDEPVRDDEHADDHDDEAKSAGEDAEAESEQIVTEIERIADVAVRSFGDELVGMDGCVVDDGAVKVGFSPRAKQHSEVDEERADGDDGELVAVEDGGIRADGGAEDFLSEGEGDVDVVDVVAEEGEEDDGADDPEAILEFEVGGGEGHFCWPRWCASWMANVTRRPVDS